MKARARANNSAVNAGRPEPLAVAPASDAQRQKASALARRLNVALAEVHSVDFVHLLVLGAERLELRQLACHLSEKSAPGPVYAEFIRGPVNYRRLRGGGIKQALARAVGLKKGARPTVVDATAGLGRDAFVLACLGCRVLMIERSPIVAALLADGLERAMAVPELAEIIVQNMELTVGDSCELLLGLDKGEKPETVYLDPMYPHRSKSALVKKEMLLLRAIVGDDIDAPELLGAALATAGKRVVVKRPAPAPPIAGPEPTTVIKNKNSRFDIYLI